MTGKRVRFHPETDFTEKASTIAIKKKYLLENQESNIITNPERCQSWIKIDGSWPFVTHCDLSQLLRTDPRQVPHTIGSLPIDPREWTKDDVTNWLRYMQCIHNIQDIDTERFSMNGKALCLMNKDMFSYRVPHGGQQLYQDFRLRLKNVMVS